MAASTSASPWRASSERPAAALRVDDRRPCGRPMTTPWGWRRGPRRGGRAARSSDQPSSRLHRSSSARRPRTGAPRLAADRRSTRRRRDQPRPGRGRSPARAKTTSGRPGLRRPADRAGRRRSIAPGSGSAARIPTSRRDGRVAGVDEGGVGPRAAARRPSPAARSAGDPRRRRRRRPARCRTGPASAQRTPLTSSSGRVRDVEVEHRLAAARPASQSTRVRPRGRPRWPSASARRSPMLTASPEQPKLAAVERRADRARVQRRPAGVVARG